MYGRSTNTINKKWLFFLYPPPPQLCVGVCVGVCVSICVCEHCVWICVFCMHVCMKIDARYNLILFQLRYIIFTCILNANVQQQLCVVRMYVGCIKIHKFYFLSYAELLVAKLCAQR